MLAAETTPSLAISKPSMPPVEPSVPPTAEAKTPEPEVEPEVEPEDQVCAICLVATKFCSMPCCSREGGTTHFCLECIQTVCAKACTITRPALCPQCRTPIVMRMGVPQLWSASLHCRWFAWLPLLALVLLVIASTCPPHETLVAHAKPRSILTWWKPRHETESHWFFLFRLGRIGQQEYLGALSSWHPLPPGVSTSAIGAIVTNSVMFLFAVLALVALTVEAHDHTQSEEMRNERPPRDVWGYFDPDASG